MISPRKYFGSDLARAEIVFFNDLQRPFRIEKMFIGERGRGLCVDTASHRLDL